MGCSADVKTSLYGLDVVKECAGGRGGGSSSAPPVRTLVCGSSGAKSDAPLVKACGGGGGTDEVQACTQIVNGTPGVAVPFASAPIVGKGGKLGKARRWCPGDVIPALALGAIRAEAIRLLPHVKIGSAWTTTALVNAEVVLWAGTGTNRNLDAAQVLGTDVRLRIAFASANWNFGDDTTDHTTDPGKPYTRSDPCTTPQCADYYGHTYKDTGKRTITLAITWTAQFSLDAGANWTDLDQPITGPTDQHAIAVKEARGVLIPNPGD